MQGEIGGVRVGEKEMQMYSNPGAGSYKGVSLRKPSMSRLNLHLIFVIVPVQQIE